MIVRTADNLCVCCGAIIPEGRHICGVCSAVNGKPEEQPEFKTDDLTEQAFRQGYVSGFENGMKAACGLKQENEQLKRENAMLRSVAESRVRGDDMDGDTE